MTPLVLPAWLTLLLALGATLRMWRLLHQDDVAEPVRKLRDKGLDKLAGSDHQLHERRIRTAASLEAGWDCPFCFGFWLALAGVASALAWSDTWPWQFAAATLALSWIAGHVGAWLDAKSGT